jgi:predicted HAD superfamily Cof-like phosphohydrolase
MINNLDQKTEDVIEFRELMGLPIDTGLPSEEYELALATVAEEFIELANAETLIDKADALVDTVYTIIGLGVNYCGKLWIGQCEHLRFTIELIDRASKSLGIDFDRCWNEVHRSNMSKACVGASEVVLTQSHYAAKGVKTYTENVNGMYVVKCLDDKNGIMRKGKALKSVNYSEADLGKFI